MSVLLLNWLDLVFVLTKDHYPLGLPVLNDDLTHIGNEQPSERMNRKAELWCDGYANSLNGTTIFNNSPTPKHSSE
jgi:hypothetical protein